MTISAVFLDRDGVVNEDTGFANAKEPAPLIAGSAAAIRALNKRGIPVIVVSNQSGIARGFHTEEDTKSFNDSLARNLQAEGASIDGWYFCPHHIEGSVKEYTLECDCRKPKPGLLVRAGKEHGINLSRAVMIGDKQSDIRVGHEIGARTVLVLTGQGEKSKAAWKENYEPTFIARDLREAVELIL